MLLNVEDGNVVRTKKPQGSAKGIIVILLLHLQSPLVFRLITLFIQVRFYWVFISNFVPYSSFSSIIFEPELRIQEVVYGQKLGLFSIIIPLANKHSNLNMKISLRNKSREFIIGMRRGCKTDSTI